mgnify:CR=1 FL=1
MLIVRVVAVATTVANAVANVVQTGIQPDFKLYEPEGGFQGMLMARKAAERDAEEARSALAALRQDMASASMALFEERERHAHDLERSNAAARDAMETAAAAKLEREEAIAEMHAMRARCDAELVDGKADAEANVEAARLASSSVAEEARMVKKTLEETRAAAAKEATKSRDVVASLRRQLERAETSARVAADDAARALESTRADLEAARARGYEVLFLYAHVDEFVMQHVRRHRGKDLVSAEAATFEAEETSEETKDGDESETSEGEKKKKTALSAEKMSSLCDWFATEALPGRVTGVSTSARLVSAPALLTGHEPEAMRRYRAMLTMMSDEATAAKLDELKNAAALELNPKHAIIKGIERLRRDESEEKVRIAKLLAEQVFDNARVAAGDRV